MCTFRPILESFWAPFCVTFDTFSGLEFSKARGAPPEGQRGVPGRSGSHRLYTFRIPEPPGAASRARFTYYKTTHNPQPNNPRGTSQDYGKSALSAREVVARRKRTEVFIRRYEIDLSMRGEVWRGGSRASRLRKERSQREGSCTHAKHHRQRWKKRNRFIYEGGC